MFLHVQAVINTMCGQGMQELKYLEAEAFIYTNGCIDKLVNWIHSNLFLLGGIALGLAVPQVDTHTVTDRLTLRHINAHKHTHTRLCCHS